MARVELTSPSTYHPFPSGFRLTHLTPFDKLPTEVIRNGPFNLERRMGVPQRVGILVEDLYQDQEVWYPYYRLKEAGVHVLFVGTGKAEYKSKFGYPLVPDIRADKISATTLRGLIVPGGYAPDILRRYPAMVRLVKEAHQRHVVIGAICHAAWLLCSADILQGKTVTCFMAIRDDVVHAGAIYVDRSVVRDGNLITSRTPDDLPDFMRTFLEALHEVSPSTRRSRHMNKPV